MTQQFNVDQAIKGCMVGALVYANWNISKAAKLTGMARETFYRNMKKHKIERAK